ncbi:MAG: extensin family protein, partial [Parasphingorhabdus sp.]
MKITMGKPPVAHHFLALMILSLALSACGISDGSRPSESRQPVVTSAETKQCFMELQTAGVSFSPLPSQSFSGGCSQIGAVKMMDAGYRTEVTNLGPVRCELANKFAAWTEYAVKRAARQYLG